MILELVSPHTAGDPMGGQKWLNCRLEDIRQKLSEQNHNVSLPVISRILRSHEYSLRANQKQQAGQQHPERNQQFAYIYRQRTAYAAAGQPIISRLGAK
jgi:Rhodopirellula transposase DDE domain